MVVQVSQTWGQERRRAKEQDSDNMHIPESLYELLGVNK